MSNKTDKVLRSAKNDAVVSLIRHLLEDDQKLGVRVMLEQGFITEAQITEAQQMIGTAEGPGQR